MEVVIEPIPHIVMNLDPEMYDYCKKNWKASEDVNTELRYNAAIEDQTISTYLKKVMSEAFVLLLPFLKDTYPKWSPTTLSARFQFSGNLKSDHPYSMRDWHLDNGNKVVIGLWYFKDPNDSNEAGLHISNGVDEKVIPYDENTIVFLPNLPNAWHKVGNRSVWTHERRFVNIVVEQREMLHDYKRDSDGIDRVREVRNLMV